MDKFFDHVTQYPRRFTIIADGTAGTSNDPALDAKIIELTEEFGTLIQQGTPLSAAELNRRIVDEMIERTLVKEVTVLENIEISGEVDGSLIVKQVDGLSAKQLVVDGDAVTSLISDDTGSRAGIKLDGTWQWFTNYTILEQTFNIVSGNKYLITYKLKSTTVGKLKDFAQIRYSDNSSQSVGTQALEPLSYAGIILANTTDLANIKFLEGSAGNVDRDYQTLIDVTELSDRGMSDEDIINAFTIYFEGVKSLKDFKLLTAGHYEDLDLDANFLGYDYNDIIQTATGWSTVWELTNTITFFKSLQAELGFKNVSGTIVTGNIELNIAKDVFSPQPRDGFDTFDSDGVMISPNAPTTLYIKILKSKLNGITSGDFEAYLQANNVQFTFETEDELTGAEIKANTKKTLYPVINGLLEFTGTEEFRSVGSKFDKLLITNNKYYKEKNIGFDSTDIGELLKAATWTVSSTTGATNTRLFTNDAEALLGVDLDTLAGETTPFRLWIDGRWYKNVPLEDIDSVIEIDANPYTFAFTTAGNLYVVYDAILTAGTFNTVFNADYEAHYIALVVTYIQFLTTGYTITEEAMTAVLISKYGLIPNTLLEIPSNSAQMIENNTKEIRRLWNNKLEGILLEDYSDVPLDVPTVSAGGSIVLTDNVDFDNYYAVMESLGGLTYVVPFIKPLDTASIQYIVYSKIAANASIWIITTVEIEYDKAAGTFEIKQSTKFQLSLGSWIEVNTQTTKVYAVYGLLGMRGDLRND